MFKLDLEKAEVPDIKLPTLVWSLKKQESSRKHLLLLYGLCQSFWLCRSQQTVENSERDGNTRPSDLPPKKSLCRSRSKLELDMEKQTGSKLGKEYVKAVFCHPAYLTYMQNTSWETLGWMKHKLESRFPGEISVTSDTQMIPPLLKKENRNWRASWWKWKGVWKGWLKTQYSKS